jgi:hypothetical protein
MDKISRHWQEIARVKAELAPEVWIVSIENLEKNCTAGAVCLVDAAVAARGIVEKTHRLATDDEVNTYQKEHAQRRAASEAAERRRLRSTILVVQAAPATKGK